MFNYQLICSTCAGDKHLLRTAANDSDAVIVRCAKCGHTVATIERYSIRSPKEETERKVPRKAYCGMLRSFSAKDTRDEDPETSD